MEIKTNGQPRDLLGFHELTEKEQSEFSYVDPEDEGGYRFFRYRGNVYDVCEFDTVHRISTIKELHGWDGYAAEGFFSGVVVRFVEDNERVVVGRYIS